MDGEINMKDKYRYWVPNGITFSSLVCGIVSILLAAGGNLKAAGVLILVSAVLDTFDGASARKLNAGSDFGLQLDSLVDMVSFGTAPAVLAFVHLRASGINMVLVWPFIPLLPLAGAFRLARFNSQVGTISSDYFVGLPIPAGAGMAATTVLFCNRLGIVNAHPIVIMILLYILSFLMVSTIKYNSFKKPELFRKMNFNVLVAVILILIFIASQPPIALFLLGLAYVVSGPFFAIRDQRRLKLKGALAPELEERGSSLV